MRSMLSNKTTNANTNANVNTNTTNITKPNTNRLRSDIRHGWSVSSGVLGAEAKAVKQCKMQSAKHKM
jgi:hypothetical protein